MRSRDPVFLAWAEALELMRNAESVKRRFVALDSAEGLPCWEPSVDMYQQGDELRLVVALPGVSPQELEVVLGEAGPMVRGKRPLPAAFHGAAIHRLEIPYGRFERTVALPPGDFRLQAQSFENGCLVLVLRNFL